MIPKRAATPPIIPKMQNDQRQPAPPIMTPVSDERAPPR